MARKVELSLIGKWKGDENCIVIEKVVKPIKLPDLWMTRLKPRKSDKLVFFLCKTQSKQTKQKKQHNPNRQCSVWWLNSLMRKEDVQC